MPEDLEELFFAFFDRSIDPEQLVTLERRLTHEPVVAKAFVRYAIDQQLIEHMTKIDSIQKVRSLFEEQEQDERVEATQYLELLAVIDQRAGAVEPVDITERLAQRQRQAEAERAKRHGSPIADASAAGPRVLVIPRVVVWGAMAAAVLGLAWLGWLVMPSDGTVHTPTPPIAEHVPTPTPEPTPRPASVGSARQSEGAVWEQGPSNLAALHVGDELTLSAGYAELAFVQGATITIEAPARLRITAEDALHLDRGRVVARVDRPDTSFTVTSEHGRFIDLGTEFGVRVTDDARAELHVFDGLVEASLRQSDGSYTAPRQVQADFGVRLDPQASSIVPIVSDARQFESIRSVTDWRYGTGVGLAQAADPAEPAVDLRWQVVEVDDQPLETPAQARYFDGQPVPDRFLANDPLRSQWVTAPAEVLNRRPASLTFQSTIDLSGYEADGRTLALWMVADNIIEQLWINDTPIDLPAQSTQSPFMHLYPIDIPAGVLREVNEVRVRLLTYDPTLPPDQQTADVLREKNFTALRVEAQVTGRRKWEVLRQDTPAPAEDTTP